MEMIKTSAPKTSKITERRQADLYSAQATTCIEIKETLLTPEIRTAVFRKGVGTNGTLVHEMSQATELAEVQAKAAHNGCKKNSNVLQ
jgi:hypothetical protein